MASWKHVRPTDQADAGTGLAAYPTRARAARECVRDRRSPAMAWNAVMVAGTSTGISTSIMVRMAVDTVHSLSPQGGSRWCAIEEESALES
jgi:hypothetical protein